MSEIEMLNFPVKNLIGSIITVPALSHSFAKMQRGDATGQIMVTHVRIPDLAHHPGLPLLVGKRAHRRGQLAIRAVEAGNERTNVGKNVMEVKLKSLAEDWDHGARKFQRRRASARFEHAQNLRQPALDMF